MRDGGEVTKYLGFQGRAKFSLLKRLKEVIQLQSGEIQSADFPLLWFLAGLNYPLRGAIGQPYARPDRVHRLPGGRDRSSGAGSRRQVPGER